MPSLGTLRREHSTRFDKEDNRPLLETCPQTPVQTVLSTSWVQRIVAVLEGMRAEGQMENYCVPRQTPVRNLQLSFTVLFYLVSPITFNSSQPRTR